ncbi:MAG TPA: hypothetical protein PLQ36_01120 [Candidatus Gracilibacteria bacterium]|nr:hypothetical protein [Candidatus Gracilibacteria bacterium]
MKRLICAFILCLILAWGNLLSSSPVLAAEETSESLFEIPFSAEDVGLKTYEDADTSHAGARTDGAKEINNLILEVVRWFRNVMGIVATLWLVWHGFRMATAHDSDKGFTASKTAILWSIIALVASFLAEPLVRNVFYGGSSALEPGMGIHDPNTSIAAAKAEISGIINWIKTLVGIITVVMIIFTSIQSFFALGKADEIKKQAHNIGAIVMGIVIILINEVLLNYGIGVAQIQSNGKVAFVGRNVANIMKEMTGITAYVMGFFGLAAFVGIVYGGYLALMSPFDDKKAAQGKKIIANILIGVLIATLSYTLVRTLIFW